MTAASRQTQEYLIVLPPKVKIKNSTSSVYSLSGPSALPKDDAQGDEVTAGQLLCGGLFSHDSLTAWLSAVALSHGMIGEQTDQLKTELLKVQVSTAGDNRGPISLLEQILDILQQSNNVQTRIGLLILASSWVNKSNLAVQQVKLLFLKIWLKRFYRSLNMVDFALHSLKIARLVAH